MLAAVENSLLGRAALLFESSVVSILQQLGDLPLDVGRVLGGGLLEYRHEVHNLSREELLVELVGCVQNLQTDGQVNEGRELSEEACRNRAERGLGNEAHGNSHRRCKGSRHGERISAWDKASAALSHGRLEQCLREGGSELQVVAPLHSIAHLDVEELECRTRAVRGASAGKEGRASAQLSRK